MKQINNINSVMTQILIIYAGCVIGLFMPKAYGFSLSK